MRVQAAALTEDVWKPLLARSFWNKKVHRRAPKCSALPDGGVEHLTSQQLFARYFPPATSVAALLAEMSPRALWKACETRPVCTRCLDTLVWEMHKTSQRVRTCPCVAARQARLPLRLFSFTEVHNPS